MDLLCALVRALAHGRSLNRIHAQIAVTIVGEFCVHSVCTIKITQLNFRRKPKRKCCCCQNQTYYLIGFRYFITNLLMIVDSNSFRGSLLIVMLNCIHIGFIHDVQAECDKTFFFDYVSLW